LKIDQNFTSNGILQSFDNPQSSKALKTYIIDSNSRVMERKNPSKVIDLEFGLTIFSKKKKKILKLEADCDDWKQNWISCLNHVINLPKLQNNESKKIEEIETARRNSIVINESLILLTTVKPEPIEPEPVIQVKSVIKNIVNNDLVIPFSIKKQEDMIPEAPDFDEDKSSSSEELHFNESNITNVDLN